MVDPFPQELIPTWYTYTLVGKTVIVMKLSKSFRKRWGENFFSKKIYKNRQARWLSG